MKFSVSYKAQELFDKASAEPLESSTGYSRTLYGGKTTVWEDERTGIMCKVSTLSGKLMGFVSVSKGHPYFGVNKIPIKGLSYYGELYSPEECKNLWWFCFFMKGADTEAAMQKCRIYAAQLEIEGTELGKQIAELCTKAPNPNTRAIKREGEPDDGEDDLSPLDHKRAWQNCNSLTTFPTLHNTDWNFRENYIKKVKKTLDEFSKDRSRDDLDTVIEYFNTHSDP